MRNKKTLKDIRLAKGYTQQEIADLLGVSRKTYLVSENDEKNIGKIKYEGIFSLLKKIPKKTC